MKNTIVLITGLGIIVALSFTGVAVAQDQQNTQRINTITIEEDGDATWNIQIREELDNEDEVSNFQSYVDRIDSSSNNETKQSFRSDLSGVVDGANNSFERDMRFGSLNVEAEVTETATGTIGLTNVSFTWTNYARTDSNGNIIVGDILSEGYTISEGEQLRLVLPDNYSYDSDVAGGVANGNVVEWSGPYAFNNVEMTFTSSDNPQNSTDLYIYGAILLVLLLVIGIAIYGHRRTNRSSEDTSSSDKQSDTDKNDDLRTEEEKLVSLIKKNDGRLKQKEVSDKFDWSDAKVSRITNKLEENGLIEKLTIGRENVLDLKEDQES